MAMEVPRAEMEEFGEVSRVDGGGEDERIRLDTDAVTYSDYL